MAKYNYISFLSDMGTSDESVAVCKSIMLQQAPNVQIVDITHEIKAFDVRSAALVLSRAIQFMPPGVVVVGVDPGIPRDQRYIAVEAGPYILIGPDNGVLASASQLLGDIKRAVDITNPDYRVQSPGGVFSARDILAPAAGVVAAGTDISKLGQNLPLEQLVPGMLNLPSLDEGGAIAGEVWSIDRFGNIQLNISPEDLQERNVSYGDTIAIKAGNNEFMATCVETYADLSPSQLGIILDSSGMVSIVKNLDSADRELSIKEGSQVIVIPNGTSYTGKDVVVSGLVGIPEQVPQSQVAPPTSTVPPQAPFGGNEFAQEPVQPSPTPQSSGSPFEAFAQPVDPEPNLQNPFGASAVEPVMPPEENSSFGGNESQASFGGTPSAPEQPQEERSLSDILNSSQMPSTFNQEPAQAPEPSPGAFGQPNPTPTPDQSQNPYVQQEQKPEENNSGAFSGNVFDLFKSDDEEPENKQ